MKRAMLIVTILFIAVISTACINNFAVQELNNKAKIYLDNGDYDSAINRLEASTDLDGTIFETQYNLGVAYINAKKYDKAVIALTKATKLNSKFADAYQTLGFSQESYAEKLLDFENKEVKIDKDFSKDERIELAKTMYLNAIKSYKKYVELSPDSEDAKVADERIKDIEDDLTEVGNKK